MFVFSLVVLAVITLSILDHNFTVGIVLAGLIWMVWVLRSKLEAVNRKLSELEAESLQKGTATAGARLENSLDRGTEAEIDAAQIQEPHIPESLLTGDEGLAEGKDLIDDKAFEIDRDVEELLTAQIAASAEQDQGPDPYAKYQALDGNNDAARIIAPQELEHEAEDVPQSLAEPRGPNLIEKLIAAGWNWVTDGNAFVRVGVIVLFMGMTFLTRYAIDQNMIPIEVRLAAIAAIGIGLLFWGWRQRESKRNFSLIVQGGGIGLLYLTIFAGFSLYDVIPSVVAFVLLIIIVVLAAVLAVKQNAKQIALFATVGGFLAPILTSSGNNNYIGLFSYYALLNLGIFAVAWFKSWRILNFVGFVFTFLVSTIWGVLSYQKEFFSTTEPFLILFFLLYVAIGILFAHKRTPFYKQYVDSSLIFGTPVLAFGLQCAMVKDYEYGVAISAAVLGVFYLVLASVLWKKFGSRLRLLSETFLSLGVIFVTLAIPFAIDGYLSGASWAIEGVGILWVSIRQHQKYRRFFGTALIFAAGVMMLYGLKTADTVTPFFNSFFIGCVIIAIAATVGSWLLSRDFEGKVAGESSVANLLLLYALAVLLGGFELEIAYFELFSVHGSLLVLLSGIAIAIYTVLAAKLDWTKGNWVSVFFVLPLSAAAALCFSNQQQLSQHFGFLLWPLAWVVCFYGLKRAIGVVSAGVLLPAHILAASAIAGLLLWDGIWQLMLGYSVLAIMFSLLSNKFEWPQLKVLALGFFPVLLVCSLLATSIDGDLVTLSNIAGSFRPPFPPGFVLWPFGFAVYFYLVYQNREIGGANNKYLHYAGGALIGALLWWLGLGPLLLGASLLAVLFCGLWQKFDWPEMRSISMALLPAMLLAMVVKFIDGGFHMTDLGGLNFAPNVESGFYLWPLSFVAMFWTFWQFDKQLQSASAVMHAAGIVLLSFLLTWEVSWHLLDHLDLFNAWHMAWVPIVVMAMIARILRADSWPFSQHEEAYHDFALPLMICVPIAWSFLQLFSSGSSSPLPWLPIANPLDVVQIIILMGAYFWGPRLLPTIVQQLTSRQVFYGIVAYGFLWANVELLRGLHHWVGIPWELPTIISADISQTVMALFWALCGLLVTIFASKKQDRTLWFFGGVLLVAVVLKLFLVDLSAQDTIERIVSFTGVGLLLVAVGYFSPLPPKNVDTDLPTGAEALSTGDEIDA